MTQIFDGQIRFGIHSGQQYSTLADYRDLWQTAERLGYDWASVFDHFLPIQTDPTGPCFDGPTLLGAMAQATETLRCGIIVSGVTYRNPAILAKVATTIDHISDGRVEWGIGAAWYELEHEQYRIDFPSAGKRIAMLDEAAQIIKQLWTQPRTTFEGRYYQITDALHEPKPVQSPHPPLWIGGAGEKKTMRVVAQHADGWNTFSQPMDSWRHKLDVLAGHCRDVGRDPADIRKQLVVQAVVGETEAEVEEAAAKLAEARGTDVAAIKASALVGTPEQCVETLLRYVETGVHDFLIGARPPANLRVLELIGEKVAPLVREEAKAILAR